MRNVTFYLAILLVGSLCSCSNDEPGDEALNPLPSHTKTYANLLTVSGEPEAFYTDDTAFGKDYTLKVSQAGGEYVVSLNPDAIMYDDGVVSDSFSHYGSYTYLYSSYKFISGYDALTEDEKVNLGESVVGERLAFTPDNTSEKTYTQECFGGKFTSGYESFSISVTPNTEGETRHYAHTVKFNKPSDDSSAGRELPLEIVLHVVQSAAE